MSVTSIETNPVRANVLRKLTGILFATLLLPAVPASAAGFAAPESAPVARLAGVDAKGGNGCVLPRLPLRVDTPLVLRANPGYEAAGGLPNTENRWAEGATSEWNAGMNRAIDHAIRPPQNANVYAVQTKDRLNGSFEDERGPNKTLAGFEIVFH